MNSLRFLNIKKKKKKNPELLLLIAAVQSKRSHSNMDISLKTMLSVKEETKQVNTEPLTSMENTSTPKQ